jgi:hypothetical protein
MTTFLLASATRASRRRHHAAFGENELLAKLDDFGAWAFRSVTFGEFDALAGLQFFEADALKRGRMEEKVSAGFGSDESEAPVGQALDSSFSHLISPEKWHEHG